MKTIKIRFVKRKGDYLIQRKGWLGWKYIGYTINMGYGSVYNLYCNKTKEELFASFGDLESDAKAAYDPDGNKTFNEVIAKFNTDWVWGEPGRMAARATLAKGSSAYVFQFGYVPTTAQQRSPYGAGHGSDISFVFNTLGARWGGPGGGSPVITSEESELATNMCKYWSNFATTGTPNGQDLPNWPAATAKDAMRAVMVLNTESKVEKAESDARYEFLDRAYSNKK